jgi:putative ABC transport system substrate-binding protein
MGPRLLQLTNELLPLDAPVAVLLNSKNVATALDRKDFERASQTVRRRITILEARTETEIGSAFEDAVKQQAAGIIVGAGAFFVSRRHQIATLGVRYHLPSVFTSRDYVTAGGLLSYRPNTRDGYRQIGIYVGRILNGEKPGDLPVQQSTRYELVVNLKTAKALGLQVPDGLLLQADEVIE